MRCAARACDRWFSTDPPAGLPGPAGGCFHRHEGPLLAQRLGFAGHNDGTADGGQVATGRKGGFVKKPMTWLVIIFAFGVASRDVGANEAAVMAPLASRSLLLDVAARGERLLAVGERGHVLVSTDQGATWRQVPVPTQALLTAVALGESGRAWTVGHDTTILKSEDGGESWELVYSDQDAHQPLFDVFFLDDRRGFAMGAYGAFFVTSDGGDSWEPRVIFEGDNHLQHMSRFPSGSLIIVAERGLILRSDDLGETWREIPSPYHGSLFAALVMDDRQLMIFGLRGHAFRSADGGATWSRAATGITTMLTDACLFPDGRILVSALGGVLLESRDGGESFSIDEQRERLGVSALACLSDGSAVLVGELGAQRVSAAELSKLFQRGAR